MLTLARVSILQLDNQYSDASFIFLISYLPPACLCTLPCPPVPLVMGIKGRRVHMIEELSETIISFQRGKMLLRFYKHTLAFFMFRILQFLIMSRAFS